MQIYLFHRINLVLAYSRASVRCFYSRRRPAGKNKFLSPVQMVAAAPPPSVLGIGVNNLFTTDTVRGVA